MAAALPIIGKVATFGLAGLASSLLGGKKKAAAPAATTSPSTATTGRPKPIITQLGPSLGGGLPPRPAAPTATLLSSKLGG